MDTLLDQALELMALGMGTVFAFLALLIVATRAMSSYAGRFQDEAPTPPSRKPKAPRVANLDPKVKKAIELAVARYRKEH